MNVAYESDRNNQTSVPLQQFGAAAVHPSSAMQQFLTSPSAEKVQHMMNEFAELKKLRQVVRDFHFMTLDSLKEEITSAVKEQQEKDQDAQERVHELLQSESAITRSASGGAGVVGEAAASSSAGFAALLAANDVHAADDCDDDSGVPASPLGTGDGIDIERFQ